ncbi:cytochrome bd-I ubiquinol oxidase subunit 1 apoprotein [Bowdeniella nasicola]|uniref:Cytochrome bd-I ubiquinol oxidase subunit 1 apoprotein n=1 Tax=Bowdeniella nasicola TaxID=208480 RepID=A0A1H4C150_9ACTO|nr:cytochrome ubiquinol oxidase subunit I [Bowdeniella nasicola]SEA54118.1 cytochrome bd-I ubiquinol oxidase subunit 1 apoprotein [Bowdeniella nasicola]
MDALDLARWQFGITTVYHFILVPLTIGLTPLVALMQTMWYKTQKDHWLRLTKFFGKLLIINFALGVATGIVQEFQFGMNWSEYSRMVGDIFGAPLAIEALAAFFLESTFLGLWIFGWNRLSKKIHLWTIWLAAIGVNLSAYWILVANSFMQHPVGAKFNPETGRAELDDFIAVITNNTAVAAFTHTVTASFLTAGTFIAGIAAWWIVRAVRQGKEAQAREVWRPAAIFGMITIIISGIGVAITGHYQGQLMSQQQPMKMAAAEAICETENGAGLSLLTIGDLTNDCDRSKHILVIPGLASFMASNDFNGEFPGVKDVQAEMQERYAEQFGPDQDYTPNLFVTYWSFRLMIGLGVFSAALAGAALFLLRGGNVTNKKWFATLGLIAIPMPFLASNLGWIFTEMGRQPWVVAPNPANPVDNVYMLTAMGVSPSVTWLHVMISMVLFTLLYAALGVVWYKLMARYTKEGIDSGHTPDHDPEADDSATQMTFVY